MVRKKEIERDFYEEDDESYNSLHAEEEERQRKEELDGDSEEVLE